jgi:hypothetical protein
MPRLIRFMLVNLALGTALGLIFLAGLSVADVLGLRSLILASGQPVTLVIAAGLSALGPFALAFMATGFAFHTWDD